MKGTPASALARRMATAARWSPVRERDVTYLALGDGDVLVVACDSDGGLGPKPQDTVAVTGYDLGRFAVRVPLLEVIAAGAAPVLVVNTLAVEREPTGEAIIAGVVAEAAEAGLHRDAVSGSTEDNVPTVATGVGVTVLGRAKPADLRVGAAQPPFAVALLGRPMSAPADRFDPTHPEVLRVPAFAAAVEVPGVHEALPIGSSGVAAEFEQMARTAGGRSAFDARWPVAPEQSGGPSTAALVAVDVESVESTRTELQRVTGLPVWMLGAVETA